MKIESITYFFSMWRPPFGLNFDRTIMHRIQLVCNQKQNISKCQSQIQEIQLLCGVVVTFSETVIVTFENLFPNRRALVVSILAWVMREEYNYDDTMASFSGDKNSITWHILDSRRGEAIELSHVMGIMLFKFGDVCLLCFWQSDCTPYTSTNVTHSF